MTILASTRPTNTAAQTGPDSRRFGKAAVLAAFVWACLGGACETPDREVDDPFRHETEPRPLHDVPIPKAPDFYHDGWKPTED